MPNVKLYEKIPTTVYLTKVQKKAVEYIKRMTGIPSAEVIRRAIDRELMRHKIPKSLGGKLDMLEVPLEVLDEPRDQAS